MSSFSCPHYDLGEDHCLQLHDLCVPGRPGCVLHRDSVFAVPWQQRLEAKREAIRQATRRLDSTGPPDQLAN